ncbi:MAG: 16S rRNA (guanine(966)-N(2))-methyltransferase RsmD [Gammaproteobacteria bacterium]|nr:16S rRNA (guanine(966)-N(2))-methyltransferase RsmD [Gammaproteobacteria bacterium]
MSAHKAAPRPASSGRIRIIGGIWRGRKLEVLDDPELRPSGDRVRETLFNWLQPWIDGARCLDLFAGTGVLGLEALSRGAAHATFVDRNPAAIALLERNIAALRADRLSVVRYDALAWLATTSPTPYDLVFVDPPFASGLLARALTILDAGWLAPHALVYVERGSGSGGEPWPDGLEVLRSGETRHVTYTLLRRAAPA